MGLEREDHLRQCEHPLPLEWDPESRPPGGIRSAERERWGAGADGGDCPRRSGSGEGAVVRLHDHDDTEEGRSHGLGRARDDRRHDLRRSPLQPVRRRRHDGRCGRQLQVKSAAGEDVAFLDSCNGHPNPMGAYHYHALPKCVTAKGDTKTGPSHIIGLALDGFPIYGDRDSNGKKVTKAKLDRCNGITSPTPEFPKGIYHYVLLRTKDSRSSICCFSGKVDASLMRSNAISGMPGLPGVGQD